MLVSAALDMLSAPRMGKGQRFNPAKLRALREALGLTPDAFAQRIGGKVTARSIYRWEAGSNLPSIPTLQMIADAFDIDIGILFEPRNPLAEPRPKRKGRRSA